MYSVCKGGGDMGFWASEINTCRKVPLHVNFFRRRHFALPSMSLIFLRNNYQNEGFQWCRDEFSLNKVSLNNILINPLDSEILGQIIPDHCVPILNQNKYSLCSWDGKSQTLMSDTSSFHLFKHLHEASALFLDCHGWNMIRCLAKIALFPHKSICFQGFWYKKAALGLIMISTVVTLQLASQSL